MGPDLEVVDIGRQESFKAWEHGYPFRTVRWHFHPEYEIHHVVNTTGRYFVGDFIGTFAPGNLVLTGPNLPHNWVSDVAAGHRGAAAQPGAPVLRSVHRRGDAAPSRARRLRRACSRPAAAGLLFPLETAGRVGPMLGELVAATGVRRIELFMGILGALSAAQARPLTSAGYLPDPSGFMSAGHQRGARLDQRAT